MPTANLESGLKGHRAGWIVETTQGETPADPDWLRFSDCLVSGPNWPPSVNIFERRCLGSVDPAGHHPGSEDHTLGIQYYLQRAITADAWEDGGTRDADNNIPNSHSILWREERTTSEGIVGAGVRVYTHAVGALIDQAVLRGQIQNNEPLVRSELGYIAEKVRGYVIDQPDSAKTVTVESTSALDTTQSVEVENDGATTTETIGPLTGTTPVAGAVSFTDIDSIRLSAQTVGNVIVKLSTGETIATIYGSAAYGGAEGDLGVPSLGAGSHEAALATAYENFRAAAVTRAAAAFDFATQDMVVTVANGISPEEIVGLRKLLFAGDRSVQAAITSFGSTSSDRWLREHLQVTAADIVVTLGGGNTITLPGAVLTQPGARQYDRTAVMRLGNTFTATGLALA